MALVFKKITNGTVFTKDFNPLVCNNQIEFSRKEGIAVVYGPNGTGKTSLIKVLSDEKNTKLEFEFEGNSYTTGSDVFHVVHDQNNRNIIEGETSDFFLGDNIRREFELQELLAKKRESFISEVIAILKKSKISSSKHPLLDIIEDSGLNGFIKDCANAKSKGGRYSDEQLVGIMNTLSRKNVPNYEQGCLDFLVADFNSKKPIISCIDALAGEALRPNAHVREIEENTEAISVLQRFHKDQCIVCDTQGVWFYDRLTLSS